MRVDLEGKDDEVDDEEYDQGEKEGSRATLAKGTGPKPTLGAPDLRAAAASAKAQLAASLGGGDAPGGSAAEQGDGSSSSEEDDVSGMEDTDDAESEDPPSLDGSDVADSDAERTKSALSAIEKAKDVLAEGVKVFLQTSTKLRVKSADEAYDTRTQVVRVLSKISKKVHSYKLMQLVASARSDPFGKIRGLIEEMIAKLTKEAAEEADQKSFCDEEIGESKSKQADLSGKLDKTSARIAKAEADKAKLTEEVKMLEEEISEIDAGQAEATKVHQL